MIEADGLAKTFGTFPAVRQVSLRVGRGEILALLGPNGAGKTTTVRLLAALLVPTAGRATIAGYDTVRQAQQVRRSVGLLTELPGLYNRMSALDYLMFFGELHDLERAVIAKRSEQLLRRFDLWEARHRPVGTYSKGMRQKVALVRALIHQPAVVILDEPTSAMDPASARQVRDQIAELRAEGRTVVVCTHNLAEAEQLADQIAIIRAGRLIAHGTLAELEQQLLGPPVFELRVDGPAAPAAALLAGRVTITEVAGDRLRYQVAHPTAVNPALVAALVAGGIAVVSLAEVPRSLESVYLRLVEDHAEETPPAAMMGPATTTMEQAPQHSGG